jgi:outer membrane protein assembly factor BamA
VDTLGLKLIVDIAIEGNKLTKPQIILREVTFQPGDSLSWGELQAGILQSKSNITNLNLFNFTDIDLIQIGNDQVIVLITVQERWYIYPVPILEIAQTNFNTWWETKELRWLNYGLMVTHYNFRGLNQKLSLTARFGYTKKFSAKYSMPNINRKQTLSLFFDVGYFENNQIAYNTADNEREFYENNEGSARKYHKYKMGLTLRKNIFVKHYWDIGYFQAWVQDTVMTLQPDYFTGDDNQTRFLAASYSISYDTRDYKKYPLKGLLLTGTLQQQGFGVFNKDNLSLLTASASYRHHYPLGGKWYAGYAITGKANFSEPPYYLMGGLGYNNFVRGYEYYVMDGTQWGLFQSKLKFELVSPRNFKIPVVNSDKFNKAFIAVYANWFVDAGYINGKQYRERNSLVNQYLYSTGLGLDFVTYYDRVFRIEFTVNALAEAGLYIHFNQSF